MKLQQRIDLLVQLGEYMRSEESGWLQAKLRAEAENGWFIQPFIENACNSIADQFLRPDKLRIFAESYDLPENNFASKNIGLVMAGNIPLVGFHDWMCIFLAGHNARVKASSKDEALITHLVQKVKEWQPEIVNQSSFAALLKGCDAYIATGSNNSGRYFDYYFSKYPHIIRRNRTSVAVLDGTENAEIMDHLADDVHLYFGLGCRNVTKLYVPASYDFIDLLNAFRKYSYFIDHHKYKNNYDYQLAIHLLSDTYYMTNGSILLIENPSMYSPISQLNYEYYSDPVLLQKNLFSKEIQCIAGKDYTAFGQTQNPSLTDYADGADTMRFLMQLGS